MNLHQNADLTPRVDLAREAPFMLSDVLVEPALRRLSRGDSEAMIEPKIMQVLVSLAQQPDLILSRDDLIERCWGGRIVGDASVNRVLSLLRTALRDVGAVGVTVETIPKVGYRLLVDVENDAPATPSRKTDRKGLQSLTSFQRLRGGLIVLAAMALVIALGAAWWWQSQPNTEQVTVVMLPIEAGEGVDPLYASGMEGEIRSQMGRTAGLDVRAGESARQLLAHDRSPSEIGIALDTDLVWQGTLTNSVESVVLNARLIDSQSGKTVWEDSLQAAPATAQFLPLRATREMLTALGRPTIPDITKRDVEGSDYALYLTAMGLIKGRGNEQRIAAHDILEQVHARNPEFADGLAGLAKANYLYPSTTRLALDERRAIALEQAERALELDPRSVDALKVSGMLITDQDERLRRLRLATEIDPGDAEALFWLGIFQRENVPFSGNLLETVSRKIAVDPLWPASWRASDAAVEFGRFDVAREMEQRIIAASARDAQRVLARARLARIDGDLSEFLRLYQSAAPDLTNAERRWGVSTQLRFTLHLLGQPVEHLGQPASPRDSLLETMYAGDFPSRADFDAVGITPQSFWEDGDLANEALPGFLRAGEEAQLLEYYDGYFASTQAFVDWAEATGFGHRIIPLCSPYLLTAMRRMGRDAEAAEHLVLAEEWIEVWRDAGSETLFSQLNELQLAAVNGDDAKAIEVVRQLPDYGWPMQLSHLSFQSLGLLNGDPLYDDIRAIPEVRAMLDPIRAHIARERQEAETQRLFADS